MNEVALFTTADHRAANLRALGMKPEIIDALDSLGFFIAPAAKSHHSNYEGGLYDHSYILYNHLRSFENGGLIAWGRKESPLLVAFFHDLCKCDDYIKLPDGTYDYNPNKTLTGHAEKSLAIASTIEVLTEEEMLCIRYHMGAYVKEDWDGFDKAMRKYPTVLYTHQADMLASHITEPNL